VVHGSAAVVVHDGPVRTAITVLLLAVALGVVAGG
jgi:hypothetical protein